MSLSAISAIASAVLPTVNAHLRGHQKGVQVNNDLANASAAGGSLGQLPVGATSGLFSHMLQSLQHVVGARAASVSSVATSPASRQNLQAFTHSLVQALRQDGLGVSGTSTNNAAGTVGAQAATPAATASSGGYQGGFVSSLQTLIQQLGATGTPNAATSSLETSFNHLVTGLDGGGAAAAPSLAGAASSQSPNAALRNLLTNLVQNLQGNGVQSLNTVGAHVNANT
jgi:hypothetical protein